MWVRCSVPPMADAGTIASLATAGGTLVLAVATFSSTRSANRSTRLSEKALLAGLRPVLFNARPQDPAQKVGYGDNHWLVLRDGLAAAQVVDGNVYLAIPLRNVASGLAVLHGWHVLTERPPMGAPLVPPDPDSFRMQTRDLYVPAGDISFWQAAVRDHSDELYAPLKRAIETGAGMLVDLLYGDHEGGQRTITRFNITPRLQPDTEGEDLWLCATVRHWNLDRDDPR
jgi:hypothetical protein